MREAALSGKFFMYGPLPMYLVNAVRSVYEAFSHPLVLTVHQDGVTYMVMGRAISAAFGTMMIPLAYAIATRIAGRLAGLLAAAFLAFSVLLVRDSHFFSVDMSMTFFCMLTWLALMRMAERGTTGSAIATGVAFAAALTSKYTAIFMAIPIAVAYAFAPGRPAALHPYGAWARWTLRGLILPATTIAAFVLLDPMVWLYWDKFLFDVRTQITEPLGGTTRPIFFAHFFDLEHPRLYFFTNLLWWGMGPVLEVVALAGVAWLFTKRTLPAVLAAIVPVAYFVVAGNTVAPFIRYAIPLVATLTVAAGVLCADLVQRPRWRLLGAAAALAAARYGGCGADPGRLSGVRRCLHEHLPAAGQPGGCGAISASAAAGRRQGARRAVAEHSADRLVLLRDELLQRLRRVGTASGTAGPRSAVRARHVCSPLPRASDARRETRVHRIEGRAGRVDRDGRYVHAVVRPSS
jgi:4-amino-4-deoxy-L-arabinose transferase-like glycosyltransferase